MYILTYNIQIKKNSLTASTTLVEKKYCSSWFMVQVLMMSHSTTFHSVYFELSTVPKRETIDWSRSLQSSSVFSPGRCLIWFPRINRSDRAWVRFFPKWKNRFKRINTYARSDNRDVDIFFLTLAPTTNFARNRLKTRYLTLFRGTKNCVVICRASLLYEMGYPFRSTVFVPMEF